MSIKGPSGYPSEQKEYDPNEGVKEVIRLLQEILKIEERNYAVLAVVGSGTDVGKTTISSAIGKAVFEAGMDFAMAECIDDMLEPPSFLDLDGRKKVLIFACEKKMMPGYDTKKWQDGVFAEKASQFGIPAFKIDVRVYIYRPDKPFIEGEKEAFADVAIRNDKAIDDPYKLR